MAGDLVRAWLAHPLTKGIDIDDPATTDRRRTIIRSKRFLRDIYRDWYRDLASAIPGAPGRVLELGSGAGFLADHVPGLITSEVFFCPFINVVLDGHHLPVAPGALRAIVMTNVLHHVPSPKRFLADAARTVRPGGVVAMIEPWLSSWSRRVYTGLNHEPFLPDARDGALQGGGPLSAANGAVPWILFERDRAAFDREWPQWRIETVRPMMPFRYLVSGGVSMRALMPGWTTGAWRGIERALKPWMARWAMFALIVIRRTPHDAPIPRGIDG